MKESVITRRLVEALRRDLPGAVVFKHNDAITAGIPDLSVSWHGRTTWLEVKIGPHIRTRGVQVLTLERLARAGACYYVVYSPRETFITSANNDGQIVERGELLDHALVARLIRRLHP